MILDKPLLLFSNLRSGIRKLSCLCNHTVQYFCPVSARTACMQFLSCYMDTVIAESLPLSNQAMCISHGHTSMVQSQQRKILKMIFSFPKSHNTERGEVPHEKHFYWILGRIRFFYIFSILIFLMILFLTNETSDLPIVCRHNPLPSLRISISRMSSGLLKFFCTKLTK